MDTKGLIDHRNSVLWNSLITVHDIEIHIEKRPDYLALSRSGKTNIFIPFDKIDPASFTHELLHIYFRVKEVFIAGALKVSIKASEKLSRIFSDDLIEHIENCLDHIKMLPKFLKLGFGEKDFLSDYYVNKLTDEEIFEIKKHCTKTIRFKKNL